MFRSTEMVAAIAVVALVVPTTAGAAEDHRSPNSKEEAIAVQGRGDVDLRSPDARDAGLPPQSPAPSAGTEQGTGFDWGDAGIGAGSVLGLMLIALSVMFAGVHRRGRKEGRGGPALMA